MYENPKNWVPYIVKRAFVIAGAVTPPPPSPQRPLYPYNTVLITGSHPHSSGPPGVFYTYFYNHAHRLRLEKLLYLGSFLEAPTGFLKYRYFWIQVAVSEVKRPLRNRLEVKRLQIYNGYM
jgi:hypothetical protein